MIFKSFVLSMEMLELFVIGLEFEIELLEMLVMLVHVLAFFGFFFSDFVEDDFLGLSECRGWVFCCSDAG